MGLMVHSIQKPGILLGIFKKNHKFNQIQQQKEKTFFHLLLAIISSKQRTLNLISIKAAFLQLRELNQDVYIVPTKEANVTEKLWKLEKCLYGLSDGARMWFLQSGTN